ncbi:MAG TPA: hypothetical protein VG871_13925, partial [Vicinamibacterales bacterium]|nr:hypothetical protein [Vicinamibacterales bacterium]
NVVLPVGSKSDTLSLGVIQQIETGTPYGAAAVISLLDADGNEYVNNPGYVTPPQDAVYFFGPRDEFHTATMYRTDLSINYNRRLSTASHAEAFVQFEILNLFNRFQPFNDDAGEIDTTILTSSTSNSLVPFNPFTDTPVRGVNWDYGKNFGKPVSAAAYTLPRTFRFSLGVRF